MSRPPRTRPAAANSVNCVQCCTCRTVAHRPAPARRCNARRVAVPSSLFMPASRHAQSAGVAAGCLMPHALTPLPQIVCPLCTMRARRASERIPTPLGARAVAMHRASQSTSSTLTTLATLTTCYHSQLPVSTHKQAQHYTQHRAAPPAATQAQPVYFKACSMPPFGFALTSPRGPRSFLLPEFWDQMGGVVAALNKY